jgi:hypothetical protein
VQQGELSGILFHEGFPHQDKKEAQTCEGGGQKVALIRRESDENQVRNKRQHWKLWTALETHQHYLLDA